MFQSSDKVTLFDHYEANLGVASGRMGLTATSTPAVAIFVYESCPYEDCTTYATFGLSDYSLHSRSTHEDERYEFLVSANSKYEQKVVASLLLGLAREAIATQQCAGFHGIEPGIGPVIKDGNPLFQNLYFTQCGSFESDIDVCSGASPSIRILQVLPITAKERAVVENEGFEWFEHLLAAQDLDLMDFESRDELAVSDGVMR
jgi:hypothetical protein